ncbi:MAG: L-threonylcarbamoyladenylate synthase, partial [Bacteroidetes bacterium]|nr:L-threonylcarbamoyladenylate synthase [Bacteroidota bacterium]
MAEIGSNIVRAKKFLVQSQLVSIPTETVYGLAANALDQDAVVKIFKVKDRPYFDPLIVHTHSLDQISKYTLDFPHKLYQLGKRLWPGPLTVILPKKKIIPDLVTAGKQDVAIRIPNHPLTLKLLQNLPFPLAAPSANPFGYISPTNPAHVLQNLGDKVPYILDGGPCELGIESTIVGFRDD